MTPPKDPPAPLSTEELAKIRAETEKLAVEQHLAQVQADQVQQEIDNANLDLCRWQQEAELDAARSEAKKAAIEADGTTEIVAQQLEQERMRTEQLRLMVEEQTIGYNALARKEKEYLAQNNFHHLYVFDKPVGENSVRVCMEKLTEWMRNAPGCDVEIIFNSPGGSVIDGMALWDFLKTLQSKGHKLTTVAMGMAASMAAILCQAGDVRVMGRESYLMIHELSAGTMGKIGELDDDMKFYHHVMERILSIFAERSTLTKLQLKRRWERKDWYLDSAEALALKLVDEVR